MTKAALAHEALIRRIFDPAYLKNLLSLPFAKTADELVLRKDMLALLTYLKENKVKGTPSTGNFTLKAVEGIATRFVDPPELDTHIGDTVFKLRTEAEVWPVYFVHVLADSGGLIEGGMNKRWVVTPQGEAFLALPPIPQVWTLFAIWWYAIDWEAASPYSHLPAELPQDTNRKLGTFLLKQTVRKPFDFTTFSDFFFTKIFNMHEDDQLPEYYRRNLSSDIQYIVVDPLERLGVITTHHEIDPQSTFKFKHLKSITLTEFGRALLKTAQAIGYE